MKKQCGVVLENMYVDGALAPNRPCFTLSPNTQTRRLGIVCVLLDGVRRGKRLRATAESWLQDLSDTIGMNLERSPIRSGNVSMARSSSGHYFALCKQLNLVIERGSVLTPTRAGKRLLSHYWSGSQPYPLRAETATALLYALLCNDFFGLKTIIRALRRGRDTVDAIRAHFQSELIDVLAEGRCTKVPAYRRAVEDRRKVVSNWKKPEKYAEHGVTARLNWLADVGLVRCDLEAVPRTYRICPLRTDVASLVDAVKYPTRRAILDQLCTFRFTLKDPQADLTSKDVDELLRDCLEARAFETDRPHKIRKKVLTEDLILEVLIGYPHLLRKLAASNVRLVDRLNGFCTHHWRYDVVVASRSSQCYVLRTEAHGKGA